ncbi:MAG: TIGR01777 family oxidoreductase, partial [Actinomycetota bacterium]|nr:TIGR01777 family oxidoreductase [Actinomycetota bacterium]
GIGDRRWNSAYKKELVDSRVQSTTLLANALASLDRPPAMLLSASAIGFYGDQGDQVLTEDSPAGEGFLPDLVTKWEAAASPAAAAGIRTVTMRTGVVYSTQGGALPKLLPLFKLGLGGPMGNGRQYVSWISLDDEVRAVIHLLSAELSGAVNLTAPNPVTNKEQAIALAKALRRPSFLPVPAFGPRLLLGGEMANALLFDSARVLPAKLTASGFEFTHETIGEAFSAIV